MNLRALIVTAAGLLAAWSSPVSRAQSVVSEDFTGSSTTNSWYFFNGACLTASTAAATGSPGQIPGCTAIKSTYYNEALVGGAAGNSGTGDTLPDTAGNGALRFTNGYISSGSGGYQQNGAIVSNYTFPTGTGLQVTFKTVTYRGDSGGAGADGADGISFYLMDGSQPAGIGSWGGSLGYTCSNANPPYDGLVGAYLGLGMDEYGNFLNGTSLMSGYTGSNSATGDNTALGFGYKPNRIGLRGAGSISWAALNSTYPTYYPSSVLNTPSLQQSAVQKTCSTGTLWDYSGGTSSPAQVTSPSILDYAPIPNAYAELSGVNIANEYSTGGYARGNATPIVYDLRITQSGLLTFSYSVNGGAWTNVINRQSISAANGPLPSTFRFGFAGSTGGSTNIHEIMCFKAQPLSVSSSGVGVNEKQAAKIETGTQAYFAYYNPTNWTGKLTANSLYLDSSGNLLISNTANWDADCVLSGVSAGGSCTTTGAAGPIAAQGPSSRTILSWDPSAKKGIPLQYSNLNSTQQNTITAGDSSKTANRVNYLRGDRTNEISNSGTYRTRDSVLGDIVDSSPTWVGFPMLPYTAKWQDRLNTSTSMPENTGQSYVTFVTNYQTRPNVVYVGSNDGLVHGFRTGAFDANGNYTTTTTPNDGQEVLAYMPGAVVNTIHNSSDPTLDYSHAGYGHNFYVDATPATGDLYYANAWHTWLVGGLGPGGAAIYALDITNPTPTNLTESNASSLVIGEWTAASLSCSGTTNCGNNLGNTYGVPLIRRLHNGTWGVIFGNGLGSSSGDAGIYVMTVNQTTGASTFYYLSTGKSGSNGIAYVTSVDLDADHLTDYVYAGDLLGNVWRFDLTNTDPTKWAVSGAPLFTTPSGQPITTRVIVASGPSPSGGQQLMISFGTGRKIPITNMTPVSFSSGTQAMYGVWDWNLSGWNAKSAAQYASLSSAGTGLSSPYTLGQSNLTAQTFTIAASGTREIATNATVCWQGTTVCGSGNNKFGWYVTLPGSSEQVIYNPLLLGGALLVNSIVPATNSILSCLQNTDTGYTYALQVMSGGAFTNFFPLYNDTIAAGVQTDATGTSFPVQTPDSSTWLVYQTVKDLHKDMKVNLPPNTKTNRLTWIEMR